VQLTFDAKQDIRRFLAVAGTSAALVVGTTTGVMAANMDADRDGLTRGQEIRITETNPNDADSNNDGVRYGNEDEDRDGLDNTDDRTLFGAAAMDDADADGTEDGDEDADNDGTDNEDEDDEARLSDECGGGVEDDADEDMDGDDNDDEDDD